MEIERYSYICSLIIDCAAYRIGISAVQERIVTQHVPSLQQHYPGVSWTPDRVKRLFEGDGLLDALAAQDRKAGRRSHPPQASSSVPSTVGDVIGATPSGLNEHADEIRYWLTKLSSILEKLKAEEQHLNRRTVTDMRNQIGKVITPAFQQGRALRTAAILRISAKSS